MARRKRKPRLVAVHWVDAHGTMEEEEVKPINALTFGFITEDADDHLTISGEIFEDGSHRNRTAIPKGMIRAVIAQPMRLPDEFKGWEAS